MAKDDATQKIIQISLAALFVGLLAWAAMGVLFSATDYTASTETFTGLNLTYVDLTNTQTLIASGESVSNATSGVIAANSGTNYTMNNTDGSIQINCTSGYMVNNTEYSITYHQGAVDSTVATISKVLVGLVFFIVVIIILLKHAGIDVK